MDPETDRLVNLLKVSLRILGITNRELARRLGISPSYLSKLFSGGSEMRLDHVIRICRAINLEPAEFFRFAYPWQASATPTAARLRELLQQNPQPPTPSREELDEERLQKLMREMLDRWVRDRKTGS